MDKNICPLFYMIMLHRRGRVDDIIISDSCGCLGEKCQWYHSLCEKKGYAENLGRSEEDQAYLNDMKEVEEEEEEEEAKTLIDNPKKQGIFAEDKSEFSKL